MKFRIMEFEIEVNAKDTFGEEATLAFMNRLAGLLFDCAEHDKMVSEKHKDPEMRRCYLACSDINREDASEVVEQLRDLGYYEN